MRLMSAMAAAALWICAAAPAMALTVKNVDSKEQTIAVDTGSYEAVYKIAPGTTVDVNVDCTKGCAVTGPWGYSRTATAGDAIETDGKSLVTTTKTVKWAGPKPSSKAATVASGAKPATLTESNGAMPKAAASPSKHKKVAKKTKKHIEQDDDDDDDDKVAAKKSGPYFPGSFASLFTGRVNK